MFQPTSKVSQALVKHDIKLDSSVYKGGLQHQYKLDYRKSLKNGYFWPFKDYVNVIDPKGPLIEFPIYTKMAPVWKLLSSKRIGLQRKGSSGSQSRIHRLSGLLDFLHFRQPIKFDFCRLTLDEMIRLVEYEVMKDKENPLEYRPIIAIGHTKDLIDLNTISSFLSYLKKKGIIISTFDKVYKKCKSSLLELNDISK